MPGEACDDGTLNNRGCKDDCTGALPGWYCSGGSTLTPMVCTTQCGDGIYILINE